MTLVSVGTFEYPPPPHLQGTPAAVNLTIDAADEVAALTFIVGKAGTVTRVHFPTNTVTTGGDVDVRLETVNSSGQPSGSLFGTNTNVTHAIASGDDNVWLRTATLTGSATVAVSDRIAVVIANPSSSFGTINLRGATHAAPAFPVSWGPARTTRVAGVNLACILEYDDGTFYVPPWVLPLSATVNLAVNTGTNPDEVALYFTALAPMQVCGWWGDMIVAAGADFRVSLYEDGNNTPLITDDYDGDDVVIAAARHIGADFGEYTLAAGTVYRLAILPLAANSVTVPYWEISSSYLGIFNSFAGLSSMHYSSRNRSGTTDPDAAAWSQVTNRRPWIGLRVNQIDNGAGGGGGGSQGISQGLHDIESGVVA